MSLSLSSHDWAKLPEMPAYLQACVTGKSQIFFKCGHPLIEYEFETCEKIVEMDVSKNNSVAT